MGVAVLSPKHCIKSHQPPRSSVLSAPNSKPRRGHGFQTPKSNRSAPRRNHPVPTSPLLSSPLSSKHQENSTDDISKVYRAKSSDSPPMAEVRILKRGEMLTTPTPQKSHQTTFPPPVAAAEKLPSRDSTPVKVEKCSGFNSTGLLGPKPQISSEAVQIYAGSGFFISPPPSSVPVPAFTRKTMSDEAASCLRRILQLE